MEIDLAHGRDLDGRVERLADRIGLKVRGRKAAMTERALPNGTMPSSKSRKATSSLARSWFLASSRLNSTAEASPLRGGSRDSVPFVGLSRTPHAGFRISDSSRTHAFPAPEVGDQPARAVDHAPQALRVPDGDIGSSCVRGILDEPARVGRPFAAVPSLSGCHVLADVPAA